MQLKQMYNQLVDICLVINHSIAFPPTIDDYRRVFNKQNMNRFLNSGNLILILISMAFLFVLSLFKDPYSTDMVNPSIITGIILALIITIKQFYRR